MVEPIQVSLPLLPGSASFVADIHTRAAHWSTVHKKK